MDKVEREIAGIIEEINDSETQNSVDRIKNIGPLERLRLSIFNFYEERMNIIQKNERLRDLLEEKLSEKIENNEMSISQMMYLLSNLKHDSVVSTDSLLSVLKPVPNAVSPLMQNLKDETIDQTMEMMEGLKPDQIENLAKLVRILNSSIEHKDKE